MPPVKKSSTTKRRRANRTSERGRKASAARTGRAGRIGGTKVTAKSAAKTPGIRGKTRAPARKRSSPATRVAGAV